MKRIAFTLLALTATISLSIAQNKPASPLATVEGTIGAAKVKIVYSQPSARGRQIMGNLVPYDKVWRTGANEATTIEFDKPVKIEGKDLPAGRYSLFTVPSEKQWTIVINKTADQMGAFDYKKEDDILRVNVPSKKAPSFVETFNISIVKDNIELKWENTLVAFKVKG